MIFRIFIAAIALICAYIAFDMGSVIWMKKSLAHIEKGYEIGAQNADLNVVEFVSYGCGKCYALHPNLIEAVSNDGNVRLIVRPISALKNERATQKAKLVYAAGEQGKFIEAHQYMLNNRTPLNPQFIDAFTTTLTLDKAQLTKDAQSNAVKRQMQKGDNAIKRLNIRKIPTLLIDGKLIYTIGDTPPDSATLQAMFQQVRG